MIWEPLVPYLPTARLWQYRLIHNYQQILQMRDGAPPSGINMLFGVAAFPSLHVAFVTYCAAWLIRFSRNAGLFGVVSILVMVLGSVLTGWHYLIDSVAGLALAVDATGCRSG